MPNTTKKTIVGLALMGLFMLAVGVALFDNSVEAKQARENAEVIKKAQAIIEALYVEKVDNDELLHGALQGMMMSLDPHSQYLNPDDLKNMDIKTTGEFGGLGIEITLDKGWLTVVTPLRGAPAYDAGVLAGDVIVEIEGESTQGMSLNDAVKRLRGKPGSKVTITVVHKEDRKPEEITVTRDRIHIESIRFPHMIDEQKKIGYVRVINFQSDTMDRLQKALDDLKSEGMEGLIIDLRNNPGGLLDQAVGVSDLFLDDGVIVSTRGRSRLAFMRQQLNDVEEATPGSIGNFPVAVLINEGSASASEIVSAALRDNDRAMLVGAKTFGKGSVQTIIPLPIDDKTRAALKLTTAKYYTPSDVSIHNKGIEPDVKVDMSIEAVRKFEEYQQAQWVRRNTPKENRGEDELEPVPDPQLDAATTYLTTFLTDGKEQADAWVLEHQAKVKKQELAAKEEGDYSALLEKEEEKQEAAEERVKEGPAEELIPVP